MAKIRRTGIAELAMRLPFRQHVSRLTVHPAYSPFDPGTQYFPADSFQRDGRVGVIHTVADGASFKSSYFYPTPSVSIPKLISPELMELIVRGEI